MSKTNDGGPAFPIPAHIIGPHEYKDAMSGMTLRDWFAGQAIVACLDLDQQAKEYVKEEWEAWAASAYAMADAMLAERLKEKP